MRRSEHQWWTTNKGSIYIFDFVFSGFCRLFARTADRVYSIRHKSETIVNCVTFTNYLFNARTKDLNPKNENIKMIFQFVPLDSGVACGFAVCFDFAIVSVWFIFKRDLRRFPHHTETENFGVDWRGSVCVCVVSINTDSPMYARKFN